MKNKRTTDFKSHPHDLLIYRLGQVLLFECPLQDWCWNLVFIVTSLRDETFKRWWAQSPHERINAVIERVDWSPQEWGPDKRTSSDSTLSQWRHAFSPCCTFCHVMMQPLISAFRDSRTVGQINCYCLSVIVCMLPSLVYSCIAAQSGWRQEVI
jgi:hypothetical protein